MSSLLPLAGIPSTLLVGILADKLHPKWRGLIFPCCLSFMVGATIIMALIGTTTKYAATHHTLLANICCHHSVFTWNVYRPTVVVFTANPGGTLLGGPNGTRIAGESPPYLLVVPPIASPGALSSTDV